MDLDKITVNIRPRTPWEAIDIGFVLARQWYWQLWMLWVLSTAPYLFCIAGLSLILPGSGAKWALFLFWLLKPFYELPILIWVSKALFGEKPQIKNTVREIRKVYSFQLIRAILLSRFSPFRSFSLPVLMLEGLAGKTKKHRLTLLKSGCETAACLTLAGSYIEVILGFSLMGLLYWLIPEQLRWVDLGDFIFQPDNWLILLSYIISCSIFAPLYICSGFMMYISRRVELEGWDIEIGFKRIRQRLQSRKKGAVVIVSGLIVLLLGVSSTVIPASAIASSPNPEIAQSTITGVLKQKEFGTSVTEYHWVPIKKEKVEPDAVWSELWVQLFELLEKWLKHIGPFIAGATEYLLWGCAGSLIAFLLLRYSRIQAWLGGRFAVSTKHRTAPEVMFGMDLRPESLPENIGVACTRILQEGKPREAMSLLYRATLSSLVNRYQLEILSSYTEKECCIAVWKNRPAPESSFFDNLTHLWIFTAYGHRTPDKEVCHSLIDRWHALYGVNS